MPNQFFFEEDPYNIANDIEESFVTDYWMFEQYIGERLFAWGINTHGQVGDNTTARRSTPRQEFTSSTNWKQVPGGYAHTVAIKTDGTLWMWGNNAHGQLGDNTTASRSTPRQEFTSSTNWKQVSGGRHTAAIKTDGTLWAWGLNSYGQLGDNTTANRSTPRQEFTSSTNWKQVAAGYRHTVAIKTDGTLWAWGRGIDGQLGDNTLVEKNTPIQVGTATNWKQVVVAESRSIAIKTDGTLWAWGHNYFGGLGTGFGQTKVSNPSQIGTATNWKQVSSAAYFAAAIKTDGTLWSWGDSANFIVGVGHFGDNTSVAVRSTPIQEFTSSTNWKQVSCAGKQTSASTAAIKTDGTLWLWGSNSYGRLGDNTTEHRSTPRQEITSSTNWKQVSGGYGHTACIKLGVNIDTGIPTN